MIDAKTVLAYLAAAYLIASIIYLLANWCCLDTPFKNSLTKEQRNLKRYSATIRSRVFCGGIVLSALILYAWAPFSTLNKTSTPQK
jgi:hypothetical protein